jgi:putative ABC transport system substrate-binding protein
MTESQSPLTMLFSRHTKRREFITLLAGTTAWPLAARAQQRPLSVVGFLDAGSAAERVQQVAAVRKGLAEGGYQDGHNVALEFRWAEGQYSRFEELAADLVRRQVSVIVTPGSGTAALAAKAATTTIPIVFGATGDPVKEGLVTSLNQPGGNAGVNFFVAELIAKRMQLLREVVPAARRFALLVNPTDTENYESTLREAQSAAGGATDPGSRGRDWPRNRRGICEHVAREARRSVRGARFVL